MRDELRYYTSMAAENASGESNEYKFLLVSSLRSATRS